VQRSAIVRCADFLLRFYKERMYIFIKTSYSRCTMSTEVLSSYTIVHIIEPDNNNSLWFVHCYQYHACTQSAQHLVIQQNDLCYFIGMTFACVLNCVFKTISLFCTQLSYSGTYTGRGVLIASFSNWLCSPSNNIFLMCNVIQFVVTRNIIFY